MNEKEWYLEWQSKTTHRIKWKQIILGYQNSKVLHSGRHYWEAKMGTRLTGWGVYKDSLLRRGKRHHKKLEVRDLGYRIRIALLLKDPSTFPTKRKSQEYCHSSGIWAFLQRLSLVTHPLDLFSTARRYFSSKDALTKIGELQEIGQSYRNRPLFWPSLGPLMYSHQTQDQALQESQRKGVPCRSPQGNKPTQPCRTSL